MKRRKFRFSRLIMLLKVNRADKCMSVCVCICRWILNQMIGGWGVTQEVLPKQAPEAAETNGRKEKDNKTKRNRSRALVKRVQGSAERQRQRLLSSNTHTHTRAGLTDYTTAKVWTHLDKFAEINRQKNVNSIFTTPAKI